MKFNQVVALVAAFTGAVWGQAKGTSSPEDNVTVSVGLNCKAGGSCTTTSNRITIDANWRWAHDATNAGLHCFQDGLWSAEAGCNNGATCKCAVDGASYSSTYGISTITNGVRLNFVTQSANKNVGSRIYVLDSTGTKYLMFKLKNREFSFDVDVSKLPCGLNGAVYFVSMDADGGLAKSNGANTAGAAYGTGYCDSQCPRDLKFIQGAYNNKGWVQSPDKTSGKGYLGSCCTEMDIWEANSISAAYTPHNCSPIGQLTCDISKDGGKQCGDDGTANNQLRYQGVCDKNGCDFNPFRFGVKDFYGPGKTVDTTKPFRIITQFVTSDGTDAGDLVEIRRYYVQGGKLISNAKVTANGKQYDSISDGFCDAATAEFSEQTSARQAALGGLKRMGEDLDRGMVLNLSLWDDHDVSMLWLDSTFPTTGGGKGSERGTCPTTSGVWSEVEVSAPNSYVTYANIQVGEFGSTSSPAAPVPKWTGGGGGTGTDTCTDVYPWSDGYSCAARVSQCAESWMTAAGACKKTCGTCTGGVATTTKTTTTTGPTGSTCADVYPWADGYSCAARISQCSESWMTAANACQKTCNKCPTSTCTDVYPWSDGYSCAARVSQCAESWMTAAGACKKTCGKC